MMTSLFIRTTFGMPMLLTVTPTIINNTAFQIVATAYRSVTITSLHFSMIFFNADDIANSQKYEINYQEVVFGTNGGFIPIPQTLINNFIMAVKSFGVSRGECGFEYQWEFTAATNSTPFGVTILPSIQISSNCGFNQSVSEVFYMQTWKCVAPYLYYNKTISMCQNYCAIAYYPNDTAQLCFECTPPFCLNCTNATFCTDCNATLFSLVSNGQCICQSTYYMFNNTCVFCGTTEYACLTCSYAGIGNNTVAAFDSSLFTCLTCDSSINYFLNSLSICTKCTLSNCQNCTDLIKCAVCVLGSNTMLNPSYLCTNCIVTGCLSCGATPTICVLCDNTRGYALMGSICVLCSTSCTCGGYTFPRLSNGDCSTICGDGLVLGKEGCDDGNTVNYDGCSSNCTVEAYFSCYLQPSQCYVSNPITINLVSAKVSAYTCNQIDLVYEIVPYLPVFDSNLIDWNDFITPLTPNLTFIPSSFAYSHGRIAKSYYYSSTMEGTNVIFVVNPIKLLPLYFSQLKPTQNEFSIHSSSNINAVLNNNSVCDSRNNLRSAVYVGEGLSYLALLVSLFSCKIIGLELFGVLQMSFLILSNEDNVNQLLAAILERKEINGPNMAFSIKSLAELSNRIKENGFESEVFLENFNIMFALTCLTCLLGSIAYVFTYALNKNIRLEIEDDTKSAKCHKFSKYILKQGLLTFIMFNSLNIGFSTGLQIKYLDVVDEFSIICMLISLIMCIGMLTALCASEALEFGEFFAKFKYGRLQSKYMFISLTYRILMGFCIALLNEWTESTLVLLGINILYCTYIFAFEPFKQGWQNKRSQMVHIAHFVILFVHMYYRFEANANPIESSYLYGPAWSQLVVVGSVLLISILSLVKEIKQACFHSKNTSNEVHNVSEQRHLIETIESQA